MMGFIILRTGNIENGYLDYQDHIQSLERLQLLKKNQIPSKLKTYVIRSHKTELSIKHRLEIS